MDTKTSYVVTLLGLLCIVTLSVQSKSRLDRIQQVERAVTHAEDARAECISELENANAEWATCIRDNEAMEASLNVATADLRGCGQFYAQREYAADADY